MITNKQKQKVIKFINEIEWAFGVNTHDKDIVFEKEDENGNAAEITYDQRYQTIIIRIFPSFFDEGLDEQRKILLHELCHVITIPSKCAAYDLLEGRLVTSSRLNEINEEATSKIENILHRLLKGNLKYAKQAYKNYLK